MNKLLIFSAILILAVSCATLTSMQSQATNDTPQFQNLKILPQNISEGELESIMKAFNTSLGVKCGHCHAAKPDGQGLDFASDEKMEKHIARGMMQMTKEINENYFSKYPHDGMVNQISCMTCHNGQKEAFHYQKKLQE
ncbi:MAG: c-type cytochrome [Chitinophagales bacterium]|nr:c-type cytochrome [Chitinophagales bacterium]MCZ2394868.1 c-type cytochrome [Chitinophagales bacterium]